MLGCLLYCGMHGPPGVSPLSMQRERESLPMQTYTYTGLPEVSSWSLFLFFCVLLLYLWGRRARKMRAS